ncbi:MAG TPA: hypothetical protein VEX60_13565 [Pyrinomonadaceae bacterium]|nr:hypothetical protein [Pyrinomonadaceae bacterium]
MKKEDFEELKLSVIEAGKIRRVEAHSSDQFFGEANEVDAPEACAVFVEPDAPPLRAFAVCVETDDKTLLMPRKIYEIEMMGAYARVIDEGGEAAVYPAEFFIPINLPAEVQQIIAQLS